MPDSCALRQQHRPVRPVAGWWRSSRWWSGAADWQQLHADPWRDWHPVHPVADNNDKWSNGAAEGMLWWTSRGVRPARTRPENEDVLTYIKNLTNKCEKLFSWAENRVICFFVSEFSRRVRNVFGHAAAAVAAAAAAAAAAAPSPPSSTTNLKFSRQTNCLLLSNQMKD